jgi:acetylornithine deacetylase/succinyl-diaminopimelate desuccinylase-like protein
MSELRRRFAQRSSRAAKCSMRRVLISVLCGLLPCVAAPSGDTDFRAGIERYRLAHESQIVATLDELTHYPSVAANPGGIDAAADFLLAALKARGFDARLLSAGPGTPPLVFGALGDSPALRTVMFYAHYDGQPVTPSQWRSDPFVPVMRSAAPGGEWRDIDWRQVHGPLDSEWRLFGRAASDDKASIVAFLAAFDAVRAQKRRPSVNIRVAWEGEEEAGSVHLAQILEQNQALLRSDVWLIGDGPVHQSGQPMIYFGARGVMGLRLTLYGPVKAVHDGHYGNWVPNPAAMAAALIAQMRDEDGNVLIPGFDEGVRALNSAELAAIQALPPIDEALRTEFGIARSEGTQDWAASIMRPSLNVRGIRSGQVGDQAANAIPIDAEVSLDFRLVPDQTTAGVQRSVEQFLRQKGWTLVEEPPDAAARGRSPRIVRLQWEPGYPALRSDMSSPVAQAIVATAGRSASGPVAVLPMMGGSVPLYLFAQRFNVPVIGLPIVNHDNNQHAANENLRLKNLWEGIETYAGMIGQLRW